MEKNTQTNFISGAKNSDKIKDNKKRNFDWFKYIWHKINCGKNNPIISYYKDYRKKVISEENFIRGQLDIFRLEQICRLEEWAK